MKRILLIILMLSLAGAAGFLGYLSFSLRGEKMALEDGLAQSERRSAQVKQRYEEEKARAAAALRAKAAAETQRAEALSDLKAADEEKESLKKASDELRLQVEKLEKIQSASAADLSKKIAALEADKTELNAKLQKAGETIRAKEEEIGKLGKEGQALKADLERKNRDLARMQAHNKKLVAIAEELLEKYRLKGTSQILMQYEPFTKIGKIEYEKMRQEYLDRIEKENAVK